MDKQPRQSNGTKGSTRMQYHKEIQLKDGRQCRLRNGTAQDGAAALANFNLTHEQTDYLLTYPLRHRAADDAL